MNKVDEYDPSIYTFVIVNVRRGGLEFSDAANNFFKNRFDKDLSDCCYDDTISHRSNKKVLYTMRQLGSLAVNTEVSTPIFYMVKRELLKFYFIKDHGDCGLETLHFDSGKFFRYNLEKLLDSNISKEKIRNILELEQSVSLSPPSFTPDEFVRMYRPGLLF